jgi:hypothetical protein
MALTIKQARKILGVLAEGLTDEELEKEINDAELLKALYMNVTLRNNKYIHGKT